MPPRRPPAWGPFPPPGAGYGPAGRRRWGGREQHTLLSLALLLAQQVAAMERKPPVTLLLAAVQALFFLRLEGFAWVPSTRRGCLHPANILTKGQWGRLLWSPWLHKDALHLYYNLSSLLWKGSQLEPRLGSAAFLRLVAELALVSNALYLALAAALAALAPALGWPLMRSCALGSSGVLFGMKVVLNHRSPGWSSIYGVALPTKYACWGELLVMQLLVPEVSFWGHLCGILAGLVHVLLPASLPGLGSGGGARGGNGGGGGGGQQRAQGGSGGSSWMGRLLAWLWGGGAGRQQQQRRVGRTYGRGTWGSSAGAAGGAYQGR